MRIAAGILMITYGVKTIVFFVGSLSDWGFHGYLDALGLFVIISAVFIITGGVFCLKRKYWKLCFTSALLAVFMIISWIYLLTGFRFPPPSPSPYFAWFLLPWLITGTPAIIFVCIRKREWQEISA